MDALHLSISLGPLAVYLLVLAMVNLSRRPFVTTGARDAAALGVALAGFVAAGPMELFMPEAAARRFGGYVWLLLFGFYGLSLSLIVLLMRPRLVIYNVLPEQFRAILAQVVEELDADARWAGETLVLPNLGVSLHAEGGAMRNVQLVSNGPHQNFQGWWRLETALSRALRQAPGARNPYGISLLGFGLLMVATVTYWMVRDPGGVAQAIGEMLRLSNTPL